MIVFATIDWNTVQNNSMTAVITLMCVPLLMWLIGAPMHQLLKMAALGAKVDVNHVQLNARIDQLEADLKADLVVLAAKIDARFSQLDARFSQLEALVKADRKGDH